MEKVKLTFKYIGGKIVHSQEITSFVPFLLIAIIATILNPVFLRGSNLSVMATTMMAMWGILSIAQGFVVLVGEIDISIGTMFGFVSMLLAVLTEQGVALGIGIACVFFITIGLSLINAFNVIKLRVPVFIATIGMMFICKGLAKVVNFGAAKSIYTTQAAQGYMEFGSAKPLGLSWAFIIFIALILIGQLVLKKTAFGRKIYAVGDNKTVAKIAGIKVNRIKMSAYLISGTLVGLASVLWVANYGGAHPVNGTGWEFVSIAAVALGGISLIGGRGSMIGLFFGVMSMAVIYNVITLLGINENYQKILVGAFLAFAVIFDVVRRERIMGKNV